MAMNQIISWRGKEGGWRAEDHVEMAGIISVPQKSYKWGVGPSGTAHPHHSELKTVAIQALILASRLRAHRIPQGALFIYDLRPHP